MSYFKMYISTVLTFQDKYSFNIYFFNSFKIGLLKINQIANINICK